MDGTILEWADKLKALRDRKAELEAEMKDVNAEIDNADWRKAKQILQDAIKPQKGKRYLACEVRRSTQEDFRQIRLDIADCWPSEN